VIERWLTGKATEEIYGDHQSAQAIPIHGGQSIMAAALGLLTAGGALHWSVFCTSTHSYTAFRHARKMLTAWIEHTPHERC